jgi:redox-sensitive bicupin YhaK (pirin superfamily)
MQWLTAGRGVVHAEMPAGQGVQRGINIWINLSAADKMYALRACASSFLIFDIILCRPPFGC